MVVDNEWRLNVRPWPQSRAVWTNISILAPRVINPHAGTPMASFILVVADKREDAYLGAGNIEDNL